MRVIEFARFGVPEEVLDIVERPSPDPGPGQVVIRLEASPIHLADLKRITGKPWFRSAVFPAVPGYEGVGRVERLGPGVAEVAVGERVFLPMGFGAWREELVAKADGLWRADPKAPPEQLALIPINLRTAYLMLRAITKLAAGDWLIQNAANSNVGYYLIKLARRMGLRTVNVVRRPELVPRLTKIGADVCLVDGPDLAERVAAATGGAPITLGIDAVSGEATDRIAACLANNGIVANYGFLTEQDCRISPERMMFTGVSLRSFLTSRPLSAMTGAEIAAMHADIDDFLAGETLDAPIAGIYPFADVHAAVAHEARTGREREGKIILMP
jgi:NADPH:quinone reductase-like Zn-dependent oxidoreductase